MPQYNRLVSADHKGYAAYLLEKANGSIAPFQKYGDFVAAFPNGAEGDMSPNINTTMVSVFTGPSPDPFESSKIIGTREFNAAFGLFNSTQAEALGSEIDYRHKFVLMPGTPVPSSNFTNGAGLKTLCTGAYGVSFMAGAEDGRTGMLSEGMAFASNFDKTALDATRGAVVAFVTALMPAVAPMLAPLTGVVTTTTAEFMAASSDQCQFPKPIILPTGFMHWSPEILPFQMFRIGSLAIVGIPGEMTMQAGRRLQDAVRAVLLPIGVQHVLLTGLANEYSGYITTPEEFISQQYEGASTLFGRLTFDAYKEAFRDLGVAMASGKEAGSGPAPGDLSAEQIAWAPKVDHDEAPIGQTIGQILRQPEPTIARGPDAQVNVIYRSGNPRNDQRRNDTYFRIERDLGAGNWGLVAWDGTPDTRLYWNPSAVAEPGIGPGCPDPELCYWSTIRVVWNLPADAAPGRYRIRFFGSWKNGATNQIIPYEGTSNVFMVQ
jgi:neutral ceramidase